MQTAFVYILECADGSYYIGSHRGDDVMDRVNEHQTGKYPDAYTFTRRPVKLVWSDWFSRFDDAVAFERQIKGWSRAKKEALIQGKYEALPMLSKRPGAKRKLSPHPEVAAQQPSKDSGESHVCNHPSRPPSAAPQDEALAKSFTHSHTILNDAVAFKCSVDKIAWPWLNLHPSNPIVVQSMNYFASVESGKARGTLDPTKWSALTKMRWVCCATAPNVGHATHGLLTPDGDEDSPDYNLTFFDADGALVYRMHGTGVVFQTRDFEAWRKKARQKILALPEPENFDYASPDQLSVATEAECLVSPLFGDDGPSAAEALITKENGFQPAHPYHDGSGDHVNANHLVDIAQQVAHLIRSKDGQPCVCSGGDVAFMSYVELDRPLRVTLDPANSTTENMTFSLEQAGRLCSTITLKFAA